ncbi:hypothetical protein HMN09_01358900 [Mycena chlorophos]|uniref:Uncharacterized protein n=1 Tax=Mycena chlorophos TaxID=658473 RepID=A0A8H6RZH8_MYCCL|nr:hypothetical protein HMN09_01358900 [Mycena chlorophos]
MLDISELRNWLYGILSSLTDSERRSYVVPILGLTAAGVVLLGLRRRRPGRKPTQLDADMPKKEGTKRAFGEWIPQHFVYPAVSSAPYLLHEMKPPMYRPFRWGEYHVTMGIRSMQWNEWIEAHDQFESYYRIRQHRLAIKPQELLIVQPPSVRENVGQDEKVHIGGGAEAAIELVHELAEYLSRRYPTTFTVTRHAASADLVKYSPGWDGAAPIKTIRVSLGSVDDEFTLPMPLPIAQCDSNQFDVARDGREALRIASLLVQDDLALMVEGTDGRYYFQAGAILVAGFWRMIDKIGKRLDEIHLSGDVPKCKSLRPRIQSYLILTFLDAKKLQVPLERFFRRLSVDKPVVRNNYFIQISPPRDPEAEPTVDTEQLAWGSYVLGQEEEYGRSKASVSAGAPPVVTAQNIRLRTERQTLRRLPRSGAIVFTIRTYLFPVEELACEPGIAARFASAVRSWPEDVRQYKGEGRYGDVLLRYLDEMAARDDGEKIETKPYPF